MTSSATSLLTPDRGSSLLLRVHESRLDPLGLFHLCFLFMMYLIIEIIDFNAVHFIDFFPL